MRFEVSFKRGRFLARPKRDDGFDFPRAVLRGMRNLAGIMRLQARFEIFRKPGVTVQRIANAHQDVYIKKFSHDLCPASPLGLRRDSPASPLGLRRDSLPLQGRLVEAGGVEPPSGNFQREVSTCIAVVLNFASLDSQRRDP